MKLMKTLLLVVIFLSFYIGQPQASCKLDDPDAIVDQSIIEIVGHLTPLKRCEEGISYRERIIPLATIPAVISTAVVFANNLVLQNLPTTSPEAAPFVDDYINTHRKLVGKQLNEGEVANRTYREVIKTLDDFSEKLKSQVATLNDEIIEQKKLLNRLENITSRKSIAILSNEYIHFHAGRETFINLETLDSIEGIESVVNRQGTPQKFKITSKARWDIIARFDIDLSNPHFKTNGSGYSFSAIKKAMALNVTEALDFNFGQLGLKYNKQHIKLRIDSMKSEVVALTEEFESIDKASSKARNSGLNLNQTLRNNSKFLNRVKLIGRIGTGVLVISLAYLIYELTKEAPNIAPSNSLLNNIEIRTFTNLS